jgi:hypothetical protein
MQNIKKPRGGMLLPILLVIALVLVLWGVVIYLIVWASGKSAGGYLQVRISPQKRVWLHYEGRRVQIADTREGLAKAKWIEPTPDQEEDEETPAITLPLNGQKPQGWDKVEISPQSYNRLQWRLSKKDAAGSEWTYLVDGYIDATDSTRKSETLEIPSLENPNLAMTLTPQEAYGSFEIGASLSLNCDEEEVADILHNGEPVKARLQALNSDQKVVATLAKSLSDFGST